MKPPGEGKRKTQKHDHMMFSVTITNKNKTIALINHSFSGIISA
jgi:hypothetical protein